MTDDKKDKHEGCSHSDLCAHCKGISLEDRGLVWFADAMFDDEKIKPVERLRKTLTKMAMDRVEQVRPGLSNDITIMLDSPGGAVDDGLALLATIERIRKMGVRVNMHVDAGTHSMGTVVLQAADRRTASKYAQFLVHNMTGVSHGRMDQQEDLKKFSDNWLDTITNIYAQRSGYKDAKWWKNWFYRKEQVLTAAEALKYGLIDEIV